MLFFVADILGRLTEMIGCGGIVDIRVVNEMGAPLVDYADLAALDGGGIIIVYTTA